MSDQRLAVEVALGKVREPELDRTLGELHLARAAAVDGGRAHVLVALTTPDNPTAPELKQRITDAVSEVQGITAVDVEFDVLTDDERADLRRELLGDPRATAGTNAAQGHSEGRAIPFAQPGSTTRALLIASGKPSSMPTCGGSRFPACWVSIGPRPSSTRCSCHRGRTASPASPWGSSPTRTSP
jgi:metal-sulfur cluster biosynthetic enzyme